MTEFWPELVIKFIEHQVQHEYGKTGGFTTSRKVDEQITLLATRFKPATSRLNPSCSLKLHPPAGVVTN